MADSEFLALPEDVASFAWSAPMREIAKRVGISDVGLKKLFASQAIPTPPQGYWNRVHAGKPGGAKSNVPPRGPGQTGRVRLDGRFRDHVPESGPIPEAGPFASALVPESLDELRAQELKAIGRVVVQSTLANPHPVLSQLVKREAELRQKQANSAWPWERPLWDGALAQRQLRIVNTLLHTLARRGHSAWSRYSQGELEVHVTIGARSFQLHFGATGHRGGERAPSRELPANTKLSLYVDHKCRFDQNCRWADGAQRLEQQIAGIAADLIVLGEAAFRQGLVEQREWDEQRRRWAEESRRAELAKLEQQRLADLRTSGTLLREAEEIRSLVGRVRAAMIGSETIGRDALARWEAWALAQADKIDPVLSGQVLSHLSVPALDGPA